MDANPTEQESGGLPHMEIQRRSTDMASIIRALQEAELPLDGALGLTLAEIGLVLAHRAGENRWEVAGEICAGINGPDEALGDWIYDHWSLMPHGRRR